ncbi:uncharacterized protein [Halyomorpha halys]|uniref:uncharacterized protein isoform X2 n=1 Tax=Halyomorpha halys TaxID=286706 RepID=UPI0006D51E7D|nr:nascent polypeptide-associated complex subunit alpha, muscle-specific form-like isoform X2 [Halyomorpha halys]
MSAMSASSGLMPLSLISEHKAAQGGPPPVQPLARTPEKHSLVQAPKPTPNGMEPSPPLIPLLPPSQPEPQPSLPCGGKSDIVNEEDRSGGSVPEIQVPAAEPAPPSIGTVPEQPSATEAAELSIAPELPVAINQAPSSPTPAPTLPLQAPPVPTFPANVTVQPVEPTVARIEEEQESLPQPEAVPSPEPAQVPVSDVSPKAEGAAEESQEPTPVQEPLPSTATNASSEPADNSSTPPTPAPTTRQPKRTKQNANVGNNDKKLPAAVEEEETSGDDKKSKRKRLPTQPYQSPIPELNLIAKISKIDKTTVSGDDKLIVFYRNEFLAVRNAEGGFYVCQAMQNVYKSSSKIRIRWLSQVANTDHYSPDFYDNTEFDCILTNLNLEKIDKNKFRLPDVEAQRTQSILKRAIDVEKGIAPPEETSITEEHPDGLDLSLYRNEDQLKKRKRSSKNKGTKKKEKKGNSDSALKGSRTSSRKVRADSDSKKTSAVTVQQRRLGRPVKVEKPVVQRIVAAKKMGRRKLVGAASAAVKQVKKDMKPAVAVKRKNESQPVSVPEKKLKGASKTRILSAVYRWGSGGA